MGSTTRNKPTITPPPASRSNASLGDVRPLEAAGTDLPRTAAANRMPLRRTIRRDQLHQIVPLADTTIYDMERRGEFPRRFNLTSRCVVWDLSEVEAWLDARRQASDLAQLKRAPPPDVRQRRRRPVRAAPAS
jgi:prophage regulatory protein